MKHIFLLLLCCCSICSNRFYQTPSWTVKVGFNMVNSLICGKYSVNTESLISHFNQDLPKDNQVKNAIVYMPRGFKKSMLI